MRDKKRITLIKKAKILIVDIYNKDFKLLNPKS